LVGHQEMPLSMQSLSLSGRRRGETIAKITVIHAESASSAD